MSPPKMKAKLNVPHKLMRQGLGTTATWLLLANVPKNTGASPMPKPGCPCLGRCPYAHTDTCSLPGSGAPGTWSGLLLATTGLLPVIKHPPGEEGAWPVGAAGTRGPWHTLLWTPISGQATPSKSTKLSPPGTELPPLLAVSIPTGSAQAMPSHPQPPVKGNKWGTTCLPRGSRNPKGWPQHFKRGSGHTWAQAGLWHCERGGKERILTAI